MSSRNRAFVIAISAILFSTQGFAASPKGGAASNAPKGKPQKVSEIRYIGLQSLTPRDLEAAMPISIGDAFAPELLKGAEAAVVQYYQRRGFFSVSAKARVVSVSEAKVVITFHIEEGQTCKISRFWIDDPTGFKSKSVMLRFKSRMYAVAGVNVGDRCDDQVLQDRARELRDWLIAENFILANTEKIRATFNPGKSEAEVVFAIDYGERVTFGFQGNTVFTRGELNEFISQLRLAGLGKDYVGVISRRFAEEYRDRSYEHVKVEVQTSEKPLTKHVTFLIEEGPRAEISEFQWEGVSLENLEFVKKAFDSGAGRLIQRGYYVEKGVEKGILVVLEELKSHGYLSSKLIAKSTQVVKSPPGKYRLKVTVQISEGEQTFIGKIDLAGFTVFSREKVLDTLGAQEDKPFNPFNLEEGLHKLRSLYLQEAYLDFKILSSESEIVSFGENNRSANISLRINEAQRIKIGDIRVRGLQETKENIVRRELTVRTDDWWLGANMQETDTNLRGLGLFSEVKFLAAQSTKGPEYRDLIVEVKEIEPGSFEPGIGYRTDLGIKAFSKVSYNNLLGRNWIVSLGGEANRRLNNDYRFVEYRSEAVFIEPRLFSTKNKYEIGVSTKKQSYPPDFNAQTSQFFTGLERPFFKELTGRFFYRIERIRQFDVIVDNKISAIDNRSMLISSLNPSLTFDTRDNPYTTTNGWLVNAALEYAHPSLYGISISDTGSPGYQKWTTSVHRYTAITKDIVLSNVIAGGFARSNIAGREIPLIKLFRLGGYATIRGFQEESINVDSFSIQGTLTYLNLRTQIDFPLVGDLKFSPFIDAGNLYRDSLRGTPFFRAGAGAGLRYMTPVGPVNLDWGFKLNPTGDETPGQFHFSFGLI